MRIFTKLAYKVAKVLWKITKPITAGTRIFLIKDNKVLLVKHTYKEQLYLIYEKFQGGGIIHEDYKLFSNSR